MTREERQEAELAVVTRCEVLLAVLSLHLKTEPDLLAVTSEQARKLGKWLVRQIREYERVED